MLQSFQVESYKGERPIIIYGTSITAKIICYSLERFGIKPIYFADKKGHTLYMNYKVLDLKQLLEESKVKNPIILLGVTRYLREVIIQLEDLGIKEYYDACELLEQKDGKEKFKKEGFNLEELYESYKFYRDDILNSDKLSLFSLDLVVSEKCSLRCKQCSNLMQYYKNPKHVDLEVIKKSLESLLRKVDNIKELRILGGEPFMNPNFYKIIEWYIENPKIIKIGIYTNATIFPQQVKLNYFKHKKIIMYLSDYGDLSLCLQDWIEFCEKNQISYRINRMEKWHDCGKLERRNYTYDKCKEIYATCECNNLFTLLHGKLYNCPYAANAINLGALTKEEAERDYLDFDQEEIEYTIEEIRQFLFKREVLNSCYFCSGRNYKNGSVLPYEQTEKPLLYKKAEITI